MASSVRRSTLIVSGMVRMHLYPFAAQTNASAMPVLPLVGSTMMLSALSLPACSAASIIAMPMRSLTLPSGLKNSHLSAIVASRPAVTWLSRTSGVWPTVSTMLL